MDSLLSLVEGLPPSMSQAPLVLGAVAILGTVSMVVWASSSGSSQQQKKLLQEHNAKRIPHVFSMIPYVGSAIDMGKQGVTAFIRKNSQALQNSPLFTATIVGDKCVFLADPQLLTMVFRPKYSRNLDNLTVQKDFAKTVLTMNSQESDQTFDKNLNKVSSKQYHQFLFKGEELERSITSVQETFHRDVMPSLVSNETEWTSHELYRMVATAVFKATMGPVVSQAFSNDECYELLHNFDKGVIPIYNGFPEFMTRPARDARDRLLDLLMSDDSWKTASPLFQARRANLGISNAALSKSNLGLLWASVGNSIPAIFWMVLLLTEHPEAWETCRKQVEQVVASRKKADSNRTVFTLDELDKLTYIESAFWEALRMYQANFTPRTATEDFIFETGSQNYLIEKGTKIMVWWNVLHSDPGVFEKPEEYRFDRFVGKSKTDFSFADGKPLTHEPVIPFGGGEHLCPGRKFVSYEARLFVAMLMQNFDIQLLAGETRPETDPAMVGIGVSQPTRDPKAQIRYRKTV